MSSRAAIPKQWNKVVKIISSLIITAVKSYLCYLFNN